MHSHISPTLHLEQPSSGTAHIRLTVEQPQTVHVQVYDLQVYDILERDVGSI